MKYLRNFNEMAEESPAVNEVIAELKSEVGSMGRAVGPIKQINGLELTSVAADIVTHAVQGTLIIRAYHETPYGDLHDGEQKFEIALGDAQRLAQIAPQFRPCFTEVAAKMATALDQAQQAAHAAVEIWCDEGLPTAKPTTVMKPLRWKFGPA
jgi:hypothetical protein